MFKSQTQELKLKKKKDEAIKANETHEAVIINGEDVLLLRQQESETATSRVFEGDAVCLGASTIENQLQKPVELSLIDDQRISVR